MYSIEERTSIQDKICDLLVEGKSLRYITKKKEFPNKKTVLKWLKQDTQFVVQYAQARQDQSNTYANEIVEIADAMAKKKDLTREQLMAANLQIESRKWIAAKLLPKKYGSNQQTNIQINNIKQITGMTIANNDEPTTIDVKTAE